ncbi:Asp-tRNAAsn/Glu-tRNAGln amidotransferase A subunit [Actinacidiphila yanglinensis]|uniref:Asp-tRNAAsn/Glu-tRNAGln amidotransferase A subunit n=1 Tax=Actinacidiphila yanglinensis TaxID=310779 RepID=A0A1H6CVU8_9ACTN|nr:amidase [Actinacidiphila yanglinensis]SEG77084.1 Asp-tRNAAsn/Glu-tRNAGln amidotransferase A subunit [Actinacidiphila yanglinensis]
MDSTTYEPGGAPSVTADVLCDRIDAADTAVRAFVTDAESPAARRERVRAEVAAVHARWPAGGARPALFGVPVAVKDIVRVDGLPTRGGSRLPAEVFEGPQASVVDRLRAAGAVIAGKTVTAEFAISAPGPTRNPHALDHSPGGSSSGSAAAVAAGMVPLAIGTQTVGSVIRPAAYCGVVGFKPTAGRIPIDGVIPNAPSLDTLGVFAATPAAAAVAAAVLCDGWDPAPGGGRRTPVFGVPDGPYLAEAGPQAREAFARQVAALTDAGLPVRRVPMFAELARDTDDMFALNRYEAARTHAEWFPRHGALYREESVAIIRQGLAVPRARYDDALRRRDVFRAELWAATERAGVDVWICPAATGPAPRGLTTTGDPAMCRPWSYAGWPSLALPADRTHAGLPLGCQWVARAGADELLLGWAVALAALLLAPDRGTAGAPGQPPT